MRQNIPTLCQPDPPPQDSYRRAAVQVRLFLEVLTATFRLSLWAVRVCLGVWLLQEKRQSNRNISSKFHPPLSLCQRPSSIPRIRTIQNSKGKLPSSQESDLHDSALTPEQTNFRKAPSQADRERRGDAALLILLTVRGCFPREFLSTLRTEFMCVFFCRKKLGIITLLLNNLPSEKLRPSPGWQEEDRGWCSWSRVGKREQSSRGREEAWWKIGVMRSAGRCPGPGSCGHFSCETGCDLASLLATCPAPSRASFFANLKGYHKMKLLSFISFF